MQHNYNNKRIFEKTVSVIIPVYQVSQYLRECLDSVLSQTLEGMEIILIDDGSSDESAAICDEYALKDSRVIVVHKYNGGQSSARNVGLEIFTCPYLVFLDSDDYLANDDVYRKLYNVQIDTNADMVISQYYVFNDGEEPEIKTDSNTKELKILSQEQLMDMIFEKIHTMYAFVLWNKMYKAELFDNIFFEDGNMVEDVLIMPRIAEKCSKTVCIKDQLICYRLRASGVSKGRSTKLFLDRIFSIVELYDLAVDLKKDQYKRFAVLRFEELFFQEYYAIWFAPANTYGDREIKIQRHSALKTMRKWFRHLFPTMINPLCKQPLKKRLCCAFFVISPHIYLVYNKLFKVF